MATLRKRIRRGSMLLLLLIVILSALWGMAPILYAQAPFEIGYGETKNGEVGNQLGDLWVFSGCLQDVVTITMVSPRYGSHLDLYGPIGREPLRSQSSNGSSQPAVIASYTLPASGKYA